MEQITRLRDSALKIPCKERENVLKVSLALAFFVMHCGEVCEFGYITSSVQEGCS